MTRLSRFSITAAILFLLFAFGTAGRIDMEVELAEQAQREAAAPSALIEARRLLTERELAKGFGTCPPRGEGMTDIVTLVIKTSADNAPEVVACIRYAERPFTPKRGKKMRLVAAE